MFQREKLVVNPAIKTILKESLHLVTIQSNEAERSTALIGDVVKGVVLALRNAGVNASFKAQNIFFNDSKREFITDFELHCGKVLFHIIEAKGDCGLAGGVSQIKEQLSKTGCKNGCITDGFFWQFVSLENEVFQLVGTPLSMETQMDQIFSNIFQSVPEDL